MEKNWLPNYDNRMISKSVLVGKNGLAMHANGTEPSGRKAYLTFKHARCYAQGRRSRFNLKVL